jgi:hypothetical protein
MYSNIDEAWKTSNDLDKYRKNIKPSLVTDATNEINFETTEKSKVSTPSSSEFKTEVSDLKKLIKLDDGTQCDLLYKHYQSCKKCKKSMIEKFNINTNSLNLEGLDLNTMNLSENFIDMSSYTKIFKNKNINNIASIVLFGLLIIIILSMINNE